MISIDQCSILVVLCSFMVDILLWPIVSCVVRCQFLGIEQELVSITSVYEIMYVIIHVATTGEKFNCYHRTDIIIIRLYSLLSKLSSLRSISFFFFCCMIEENRASRYTSPL